MQLLERKQKHRQRDGGRERESRIVEISQKRGRKKKKKPENKEGESAREE